MTDIEKVEGIGPVHAKDLTKAGIHTTEDLLREGLLQAEKRLKKYQGFLTNLF